MSIPTPHNSAKKGDIAKKVLMPPCLNVSAVLAHSGRLLTQIPAGISLFRRIIA